MGDEVKESSKTNKESSPAKQKDVTSKSTSKVNDDDSNKSNNTTSTGQPIKKLPAGAVPLFAAGVNPLESLNKLKKSLKKDETVSEKDTGSNLRAGSKEGVKKESTKSNLLNDTTLLPERPAKSSPADNEKHKLDINCNNTNDTLEKNILNDNKSDEIVTTSKPSERLKKKPVGGVSLFGGAAILDIKKDLKQLKDKISNNKTCDACKDTKQPEPPTKEPESPRKKPIGGVSLFSGVDLLAGNKPKLRLKIDNSADTADVNELEKVLLTNTSPNIITPTCSLDEDVDEAVNFEDPADANPLHNANKERVKGLVKRRPPTWKGRHESARRSGVDFLNEDEDILNILDRVGGEAPLPSEICPPPTGVRDEAPLPAENSPSPTAQISEEIKTESLITYEDLDLLTIRNAASKFISRSPSTSSESESETSKSGIKTAANLKGECEELTDDVGSKDEKSCKQSEDMSDNDDEDRSSSDNEHLVSNKSRKESKPAAETLCSNGHGTKSENNTKKSEICADEIFSISKKTSDSSKKQEQSSSVRERSSSSSDEDFWEKINSNT